MAKDIYVQIKTISGSHAYDGQTVLTFSIEYPRFSTVVSTNALQRINEEYRNRAVYSSQLIRSEFYPMAIFDYQNRNGAQFAPYEFITAFSVTYNDGCITSLYTDDYRYTGGAHGVTVRTADTWNMRSGVELALSDFFPGDIGYTERIQQAILREISLRTATPENQYLFFENVETLVRDTFSSRNFYLVPDQLAFFFQQYDIAPYSTGIPVFTIPFGDIGARLPVC